MARTRYVHTAAPSLLSLPAAAMRAVFAEGYGAEAFRADLLAGLVVGIVALPLSMALAIAVGVPPQHGLYTAIVAGLTVPLIGGSRFQVSGPTAAFIVILAPVYVKFGLAGLLVAGALAGLMLIAMGVARLGRLIQFVPHPVTTGFTAGIGLVIAVLQLKDLLGLRLASAPDHFLPRLEAMWAARHTADLHELGIGALTLLLLAIWPRLNKRIPAPLVALGLAGVAAALLHRELPGFDVATIGSRFQSVVNGQLVRGIPRAPPAFLPPWLLPGPGGQPFVLTLATLRELLPAAFAIALLGAIESLLSAVVADAMGGTKHDPDSELLALGVGNLLCPFFGGIACTGAIARTATNLRSGAKSPISSVVHAGVILAAVLLLAPLLSHLPMAALAALLLLVAWNMSDAKHFFHVVRVAPKSDVTVLLLCFGLTVVFDMVIAVSTGMVVAAFLFMRRMAEVATVQLVSEDHPHLGKPLPAGAMMYEVSGPLFFGAAEKAMAAFKRVNASIPVMILYLGGVPAMDVTGLVALESALARLKQQGTFTILTALKPQPLSVLEKAGIRDAPGALRYCATLQEAVEAARAHLGKPSAYRAIKD